MMSFLTYITGFFMNFEILPIMQIKKKRDEIKKIFSSETIEPISTKLCWNDPWVVPFHNCVRQRRPVSNMAAITQSDWAQPCVTNAGYMVYTTWLRLFLHEPNTNCDQSFIKERWSSGNTPMTITWSITLQSQTN